jgi:phosphoribosyl-AMP cyclohydrolase / phosphoribosyl-ATP pyrophosphohydrolase
MPDLSVVQFNEQGLIPAIVQDVSSGQVLMLAYMNREALEKTVDTGLTHYWSRSRKKLWQKGEISGHFQHVQEIRYDCDADTLLVLVAQEGAACHTGKPSCFFQVLSSRPSQVIASATTPILEHLYEVVLDRKQRAPQESYVASLMARGQDQVLKKVVEEAAEVALASKNGRTEEILYEMADLWFHTIIALGWHNLPPQEVFQELRRRLGTSGLRSHQRLPDSDLPQQSA